MTEQTIFDRAKDVSPSGALLAGLVTGTLLVLFSFLLGIDSVKITASGIEREVGYAAAPNWSLVFTIVFPLFLYFALGAIRSTDRSLHSLERMLVEPTGKHEPDAASSIARRFRKALKRSGRVVVVLGSLAVIGSIAEWFAFSAMPLLFGSNVPEGEVDWAVAALGASLAQRLANSVFSFTAFTLQGIYIAALLAFLVYVYVFAEFVRQLTDANEPPMLVPDVDSPDPRRGFQRLGRVVEEIIFASGCLFLVFWFSRLQNLYLQSTSASLWQYLRGDLSISVFSFDLADFVKALADSGGVEFSSTMVVIGSLAVLGVCIGVPLHTLRRAAESARETARDLASRRPRVFARHYSVAELEKRLEEMTVWPIAYPRVNELLFWLVFALLSLVFYRIGVAFVLIWVWRLVQKAFKRYGGNEKEPGPKRQNS